MCEGRRITCENQIPPSTTCVEGTQVGGLGSKPLYRCAFSLTPDVSLCNFYSVLACLSVCGGQTTALSFHPCWAPEIELRVPSLSGEHLYPLTRFTSSELGAGRGGGVKMPGVWSVEERTGRETSQLWETSPLAASASAYRLWKELRKVDR